VVAAPALTIITAISYDHMKFLGNSLSAIAHEKAGILKSGVPCVVGYQFDEALAEGVPDVILQASQNLSPAAPLCRYGAEWSTGLESGQMLFRYEDDSILLPKPSLPGNHQTWNAGAALAAFRIIAPGHFKPEILSTALGNIEWPGRLQTLENHVFQSLVPQNWEIVIDGGHNDTAGLVLARQMEEWRRNESRPLHLVVAMVNRKEPTAFLKPLLPYADSLTVTRIEGEATSFTPEDMEAAAKAIGFQKIYKASSAREAIETIVRHEDVQAPSRVLMAGSLFFMGNILSA
jgi:dihydrofolate synthase/folylpolyglutamate synthase